MTREVQQQPALIARDSGARPERMVAKYPPQRHTGGDAGGSRETRHHRPDTGKPEMGGQNRHTAEYLVGTDLPAPIEKG